MSKKEKKECYDCISRESCMGYGVRCNDYVKDNTFNLQKPIKKEDEEILSRLEILDL